MRSRAAHFGKQDRMTRAVALVVFCNLVAIGAFAGMPPLRDPFEPPRASAKAAEPDDTVAAQAQRAEPAWPPPLRAIVFDGAHSLINLGGQIMAIGETVSGYRLVKVEERSAIFIKNGVPSKIMLDKGN
jgi:hypothetical protein